MAGTSSVGFDLLVVGCLLLFLFDVILTDEHIVHFFDLGLEIELVLLKLRFECN